MLFHSTKEKKNVIVSRLSIPLRKMNFIAIKEKMEHFGIQITMNDTKRGNKINSFRSINLILILILRHINAADFVLGTRSIEIHRNAKPLKVKC